MEKEETEESTESTGEEAESAPVEKDISSEEKTQNTENDA